MHRHELYRARQRYVGGVRQEDRFGCAIACLAMVLERTYAEVRAEIGDPGTGFTEGVWTEFLIREGFAVQHLYKTDQLTQKPRRSWPLDPWAPMHLCLVDAGAGGHLVVLLRNGMVLDPASPPDGKPGCLGDYRSVMAMTGLFRVHGWPAPPIRKVAA